MAVGDLHNAYMASLGKKVRVGGITDPVVDSNVRGIGGPGTALISELSGGLGAWGGAGAGAALGTAILPGVGTLVGAGLGAAIGGFGGGTAGRAIENRVRDNQNFTGKGGSARAAFTEGAWTGALSGAGQAYQGVKLAKAAKAAGIPLSQAIGMAPGEVQAAAKAAKTAGTLPIGEIDNVTKAAKLTAGGNAPTRAGNSLYRSTLGIDDIITPGKTKPTTIFSADELVDEARRVGLKGSPKAMQRQVGAQYKALGAGVDEVLSGSTKTTSAQSLISEAQKDIAGKLPIRIEGTPVKEEIARSLQQLGKGKVTASQLYEFKNGLDVSSAFTKLANGGNLTAKETADLALWKQADTWITKLEPAAKELTTRQSKLYSLAQGLGRMTRTPGDPSSMVDLGARVLGPGIRRAENATGRALMGAGNVGSIVNGTVGRAVSSPITQGFGGAAAGGLYRALSNSNPAAPQAPEADPNMEGDPTMQAGLGGAIGGGQAPQSRYPLQQAIQDFQANAGNPKVQDQIMQYYDWVSKAEAAQTKATGSGGANVGKVSAQQYQLSQQGLNALGKFAQLIQKDPNVITRSATPGRGLPVIGGYVSNASGTSQFDTLGFAAISSLLRAQSGAAVPDSEVRSYMKNYLPRAGDSKETVAQKLQTLQYAFQTVLQGAEDPNATDPGYGQQAY